MSYCDFNSRLFKPFTSKKTKIIPSLSDDWEIIPSTYVKLGGFSLKSQKLNQEVADIPLRRFLTFCKEQKLVIDSLNLIGKYIIGNDRSVYTVDMYNKWREKYEKRTEDIISYKDYEPGCYYVTPCGMKVLYLGSRYICKIKNKRHYDVSLKLTKPVKKHFIKETYYNNSFAEILTRRLAGKIERELSNKETSDLLNILLKEDNDIVYCGVKKPTDNKIVLIETDNDEVCIVEINNKLYRSNDFRDIRLYYPGDNTYQYSDTNYYNKLFIKETKGRFVHVNNLVECDKELNRTKNLTDSRKDIRSYRSYVNFDKAYKITLE